MTNLSVETYHLTDKLHFESQLFQELLLRNRDDHKKHGNAMSRKAFFAAHCTHRFDQLYWGRLSEKSNIPQCESRIRFWPCIRGTEYFSLVRTFRTVWGRWNYPIGAAESERYSSMSERETPSERDAPSERETPSERDAMSERDAPLERETPSEREVPSERGQNATLMPPTMRPVIPMPSSTKPRTLCPPAWTQTAPA